MWKFDSDPLNDLSQLRDHALFFRLFTIFPGLPTTYWPIIENEYATGVDSNRSIDEYMTLAIDIC